MFPSNKPIDSLGKRVPTDLSWKIAAFTCKQRRLGSNRDCFLPLRFHPRILRLRFGVGNTSRAENSAFLDLIIIFSHTHTHTKYTWLLFSPFFKKEKLCTRIFGFMQLTLHLLLRSEQTYPPQSFCSTNPTVRKTWKQMLSISHLFRSKMFCSCA